MVVVRVGRVLVLGRVPGRVGCREGLGALEVDEVVVDLGVVGEVALEVALGLGQDDAVLRALRSGDRRDDGGEVEFEVLAEDRLLVGVVPERLQLGVGLDERDLLLAAAGEAQVVEGDVVDREHGGGRAELGAHVADGGAVGEGHGGDAGAVELDELADDAVLAQHVGDREHDIRRRDTRGDDAGELEADDLRDEHGDGLAEHGRLGLDAADAPAEHAEAVDHGGVRVGADAGVGVGAEHAVDRAVVDDLGQVLDVDLVHDAGSGRDDLEVVERRLAPAQELVALAVALVLDLDVALEGVLGAEQVGDDGVVDDHLGRSERVDLLGVSAERLDGLAHGGEVDDAGDTGEVLHHDARGRELDLGVGLRRGNPRAEGTDVRIGDVRTVLGAEQVLQEHLEAERELLVAVDGVDAEDLVVRLTDPEGVLRPETVYCRHVASP